MSKMVKSVLGGSLVAGIVSFLWLSNFLDLWRMQDKLFPPEEDLGSHVAQGEALPLDIYIVVDKEMTSLHWQLYSYPLETTRNLARWKDQALLFVWSKVLSIADSDQFSWHESFLFSRKEGLLPVPVFRVLEALGVQTQVFSNRGSIEKFKLSQIFKRDVQAFAQIQDLQITPKTDLAPQVKLVFLSSARQNNHIHLNEEKSLNIWNLSAEALGVESPQAIKDYDDFVKSRDQLLSEILSTLDKTPRPSLLIYTAEKGDFIFENNHEVQYSHYLEQGMIPFVVGFNSAFRESYPDKVELLRRGAQNEDIKNFGVLSSLVVNLFEKHTDYKVPMVNLEKEVRAWSIVDSLTKISFLQNFQKSVSFCAHRSNTWAKTLRALHGGRCVELDIVVTDSGELEVNHPPKPVVGYTLKNALDLIVNFQAELWLDGKNFTDPKRCGILLEKLKTEPQRDKIKLIEFGSDLEVQIPEIARCLEGLKSLGLARSYYVPTDLGRRCADAKSKDAGVCQEFYSLLRSKIQSGLFSDLSFDYRVLPAMEQNPELTPLQWNTWGLDAETAKGLDLSRFKLVIITTPGDPNTR